MKNNFMRYFNLEKNGIKFSKHLKSVCIFLLITVVMSQIGLLSETTRHFLTGIDILDGALPASGNGIVEPGEVVLHMDKGTPCDNITILINGDEYSKFAEDTVHIEITNQSVIEILNDSKQNIEVSITSVSDNLIYTYKAKDTSIDKFSVICRVIFKS